ncbi:MAG TPA: hypothetical protein VGN63_19505 [Flavisolibacter sp.]|nr:hypothetical protein [Flavisolibacter sp.]
MLKPVPAFDKNVFTGEVPIEDPPASESKANLKSFEHLRITDQTAIPPVKVYISIDGHTIATGGDLIAFSGGVKTGKSSIQDPLISTAITTDGVINDPIDHIEVLSNPERKAVIHIDTEQSKGKHKEKVLNILRRAKKSACPEHFLSYNLRELNLDEYKPITTGIFEAAATQFGGVHLAVIDGIADYISDPNDTAESNGIVKFFEQIAIKYECPVLVIIHTNPNSDKERGNLGSQCIRKAASVLSVKCEDDISYLEPKYLRNAGRGKVPIIEFTYDPEKCYHVSCGIRSNDASAKPKSHNSMLQNMVEKIFAPPLALEYGEAIAEIMKYLDKAERTAKTRFSEIKTLGLIEQGADKNWRKKL